MAEIDPLKVLEARRKMPSIDHDRAFLPAQPPQV